MNEQAKSFFESIPQEYRNAMVALMQVGATLEWEEFGITLEPAQSIDGEQPEAKFTLYFDSTNRIYNLTVAGLNRAIMEL